MRGVALAEDHTFEEQLRLTLEDSRELIRALQYLVDTAKGPD